ncbi:MAG: MerR family transcriptional regulator [Spirochaetota bacterium]|nr:MerR family transcriptional regulator [Spirochaetota bacterium]
MSKDGKKHYTIGEVSEIVDLKEHVLRFWEKEFPQLAPQKSAKGRRKYTDHDIRVIERIKHLLYVEKFTVDGGRMQLAEEFGNELPLNLPPVEKPKPKKPIPPSSTGSSMGSSERKVIVTRLREIVEMLK